jgi:hypothetical protein
MSLIASFLSALCLNLYATTARGVTIFASSELNQYGFP